MISVLFADDEQSLLGTAKLFLEDCGGFRVDISTSEKKSLEPSHILSCDAIISDYQMPWMDGIVFLKGAVHRDPLHTLHGQGPRGSRDSGNQQRGRFLPAEGWRPCRHIPPSSAQDPAVFRRKQAEHSLLSSEDLVVVWEDNGVGIAVDEKERIFDRGFGKNTGLGMFLVREILSLTGISIRETGEPGEGARFEIVIPRKGFRNG